MSVTMTCQRLEADPAFASLRVRSMSTTATRSAMRAMDALYARSSSRATLPSTSAATSATASASFRRLGARVVALEPQPSAPGIRVDLWRATAGRHAGRSACGRAPVEVKLRVNSANPTCHDGIAGLRGRGRRRWRLGGPGVGPRDRGACTTLDALIAAHGSPAFVKIDVEGFEDAGARRLDAALPALSFEFTTHPARRCAIAASAGLRRYRPTTGFNVALGESQQTDLRRARHCQRHGRPHCSAAARGQFR